MSYSSDGDQLFFSYTVVQEHGRSSMIDSLGVLLRSINILNSVSDLPLQDQSVDKIVCDAPFGHKHTIEMKMDLFYQMLMHQMAR